MTTLINGGLPGLPQQAELKTNKNIENAQLSFSATCNSNITVLVNQGYIDIAIMVLALIYILACLTRMSSNGQIAPRQNVPYIGGFVELLDVYDGHHDKVMGPLNLCAKATIEEDKVILRGASNRDGEIAQRKNVPNLLGNVQLGHLYDGHHDVTMGQKNLWTVVDDVLEHLPFKALICYSLKSSDSKSLFNIFLASPQDFNF